MELSKHTAGTTITRLINFTRTKFVFELEISPLNRAGRTVVRLADNLRRNMPMSNLANPIIMFVMLSVLHRQRTAKGFLEGIDITVR
jgi:hypothetical protein